MDELINTAERERLFPFDSPEKYVGRRRAFELKWYQDPVKAVWVFVPLLTVAALAVVLTVINLVLGNTTPAIDLILP